MTNERDVVLKNLEVKTVKYAHLMYQAIDAVRVSGVHLGGRMHNTKWVGAIKRLDDPISLMFLNRHVGKESRYWNAYLRIHIS